MDPDKFAYAVIPVIALVGIELAGNEIGPVTFNPLYAVKRPVNVAPDNVAYAVIPVIALVGIELEGTDTGP